VAEGPGQLPGTLRIAGVGPSRGVRSLGIPGDRASWSPGGGGKDATLNQPDVATGNRRLLALVGHVAVVDVETAATDSRVLQRLVDRVTFAGFACHEPMVMEKRSQPDTTLVGRSPLTRPRAVACSGGGQRA
jgi:hypothetical protein